MKSAPCKTSEADPIPATLLKSSIAILGPTLRKLINSSITTGVFYPSWNRAIIRPKLKRQNLEATLANYRPLSNLSFISKLSEKASVNQLVDHLNTHDLLPSMQSAYRQHHSTETALLKVKNDLLLSMNRQHVTLLVFLDLSSAFDTVDHTILLDRLESLFGISGTALSWFKSYLSDRKQCVSVDGVSSSDYKVKYGVPQGSCLGPLFLHCTPVLSLNSLNYTYLTPTAMLTTHNSISPLNQNPQLLKGLPLERWRHVYQTSVTGSLPTNYL